MKYLLFMVLFIVLLTTAGCTGGNPNSAATQTPVHTTVHVPSAPTTTKPTTTAPAPTPTPLAQRQITDGFWCRDITINIGKAPTDVRECYQFFTDGTYKWGYSPGRPMGKSLSCSGSPDAKCAYSLNANGQYEVEGGYSYNVSGDELIDPHDPPYYIWSSTGIP